MPSPDKSIGPKVLVIDDEPPVIIALRTTLEYQNYCVVATSSTERALRELECHQFAVILSDQRMPAMTGLEFFQQARRIQPDASRVLITGMIDPPTLITSINEGEIYRFIAKPWLREELIATVRNAAHRYELVTHNQRLLQETIALNQQNLEANRTLAAKVAELEESRLNLAAKNQELVHRYELSLELCCRIQATHDPELAGRTRAIAGIVEQLLAAPCFTTEERSALRASAWLCDLGLVGMSRETLAGFAHDPDQLSTAQLAEIHRHPTYSQTLATHVDGRTLVSQIIRSHHERFDGDGYPDGLVGNAILWPARCLAAAVVMVESELPFEEALALVARESGRALDPQAASLIHNYATARADSHFQPRDAGRLPHGSAIYRADGMSLPRASGAARRSHPDAKPAAFCRVDPPAFPRLVP